MLNWGIFISLIYWIPFIYLSFLGHVIHGILCGISTFTIWIIYEVIKES